MDLEKKVNKNTKRIGTMEHAIQLLVKLADSHTDQIEKMLFGIDELRASQKETQEKINMLVDAQIRNEDRAAKLDKKMKIAQKKSDLQMTELAEASKFRDQKMAELAEASKFRDQKMAELADVVKFAHQRINKIEKN